MKVMQSLEKLTIMQKIVFAGTILLLLMVLFNFFSLLQIKDSFNENIAKVKEGIVIPEIDLFVINATACDGCFQIDLVTSAVKEMGVSVTSETLLESDSTEAKNLIARYNIQKLPSLVITGDINAVVLQGFEKRNDAMVFTSVYPPFVDVATGDVLGKVNSIVLAYADCEQCLDLSIINFNLKQSGVVFSEELAYGFDDPEAAQLIADFNITKLPSMLLSQNIEEYGLGAILQQAGYPLVNGFYVIESQPPFLELASGEIKGLVSLTGITDESCIECFDVNELTGFFKNMSFENMSLFIDSENYFDVSSDEGTALVEQYEITKIPTVILQGDLATYTWFDELWSERKLGTIAGDGSHIFRNLELGKGVSYKDLNLDQVVTNEAQSAEIQ